MKTFGFKALVDFLTYFLRGLVPLIVRGKENRAGCGTV
jgi:hypothetical protein